VSLEGLIQALAHTHTLDEALAAVGGDADFSVPEGLRAPLLTALLGARSGAGTGRGVLAITPTSREAEALETALGAFDSSAVILDFPAWETLPHERLSPSAEIVGKRIMALASLRDWAAAGEQVPAFLVTSVRAALQPLAPTLLDVEPLRLIQGADAGSLSHVARRLVDLAYTRVDMVTRRGEFAVRGGILDVFSPVADHPHRVDFFGEEIDQIREFSVADQRSMASPVDRVILPPSRELLLSPAVRGRAAEMQHEFPGLSTMLAKIAEGIPVEGMESLAPALIGDLVPLTHYLPEGTAIAVVAPERVAARALSLAETNREFLSAAWSAATVGAEAPIDLNAGGYLTLPQLRDAVARAGRHPWWSFTAFDAGDADADGMQVRLAADPVPSFRGNVDGALDHIADLLRDRWSVVVAAEGPGLVDRASAVMAERNLSARVVESIPDTLEPGVAYLTKASVEHGFELPGSMLAVIGEDEFYGRSVGYDARQAKKLASRRKRNAVDPLQLKAGDFVVHQTHGIGRFLELTQRPVTVGARAGANRTTATREYVVLEYAASKRGRPADRLYVPTDQLDLLSRYVGGETPTLSKMGGSDWAAAKGRARKAVRDIAVELVKLYSARMASKGHAFAPDTPWQRELEDAFPFVETPDQLTTIDEVKADMERPIPMDRLVSGDVGFGKTEIAVRAAFKAVQDGKQVLVLVPTTLLVRQHLETFQERFAGFPIHLRALSRFQSDKEARETLAGLADGTVDVVIGTHRLLAKDLVVKDLGLVVIDEEQRFGVQHKDALKKLKTDVDVLAMSATPIPRTLEMAVTGIREMSTLATPPEDRHPILTYVGPYSDRQAAAAIRRELLREGQVFFVHNRVSTISRTASRLAELVPEARIAVAHGKLPEQMLEQVVVDFWERKYDILVCTTIIETGLDIANANTIIIDRADKYGLSQLHQLRGRVGRGRERAYAYFLWDDTKPLSETAHDRLATIAANNELGSGMQVALKDLELRGAGNLLGAEQAGHIAGVGFDLYLRMIGEAVDQFRGEVAEGQTELRLELPVDARIPDDYVDSERLRLEAYQKLSTASAPAAAPDAIDGVVDELTDRYGTPPEPVQNLIAVSRLRRHAQKAGLGEVVATASKLRVSPADLADSVAVRLQRMYPGARVLTTQHALSVPMPTRDASAKDAELIAWVGDFLGAIFPVTTADRVPAAE
jgi:transcription-repair coupling factor (superfamily II helicase)